MSFDPSLAALCLAAFCSAPTATTQKAPPSLPTVLSDVRLSEGPEEPRVAIVLEKGRIVQLLGEGAPVPSGYRVIEAKGALALPAFIDTCSHAGCEPPDREIDRDLPVSTSANVQIDMREANRKGLQPSFRTVEALTITEETLTEHRGQGFAVLHTSPSGMILGGTTALTTTRSSALRDRVLLGDVFQSASFTATGPGYPVTLMGRIAHLRQFLLDATWHEDRRARHRAGRADIRPPYDPDLEAILPVLRGERSLLCRADGAQEIHRWLELARAHDLKLVLCGGREAWRVTDALLGAEIPVILDLDWGEEVADPDAEEEPESTEDAVEAADWIYREPIAVERERRRRWEEKRDCALRLHEAGIPFAFGTFDSSPVELLTRARSLVEAGLPEEAALAALTTTAAGLVDAGALVGRIQVGHDANIALWSDSPFEKTAHLEWLIVDGVIHEFDHDEEGTGAPGDGVDFSGVWEITYAEKEGSPSRLELDMSANGSVKGTLSFEKADGERSHSEVEGTVSGRRMNLEATVELGGFSALIRLQATIVDDSLSGDATWKYSGGEETSAFSGQRQPPDPETGSGEDERNGA